MKRLLMIAGPNGAGKTTFSHELIASSSILYEYLNADEIARGLAPLHPEKMALTASKLMIQRLKALIESDKSFAFETTAAGTNYIHHLKRAKEQGYEINLIFLWLDNPQQAIRRVAKRVKQGGHNIPEETIIRRYYAGVKNLLSFYLQIADRALIIDNSAEEISKQVIAIQHLPKPLEVVHLESWIKLEQAAYER